MALPQRHRPLIFGRPVAGERGRVILELDHDVAGAAVAFHRLGIAAAHQKPRAVFAERLGVRRHVGLVAVRIGDIDVRDPISLWHAFSSVTSSVSSPANAGDPVSACLEQTHRQSLVLGGYWVARTSRAMTRSVNQLTHLPSPPPRSRPRWSRPRLSGRSPAGSAGRPRDNRPLPQWRRSEEHTSELQSPYDLVCPL